MAWSATNLSTSSDGTNQQSKAVSVTYSANRLIFVGFQGRDLADAATVTASCSGLSITWTQIAKNNSSTDDMAAWFVGKSGGSGGTGDITISWSGSGNTYFGWSIFEVEVGNALPAGDGIDAIVQEADATTSTVSLASATTSGNRCVGFAAFRSAAGTDVVQPTDWTEISENFNGENFGVGSGFSDDDGANSDTYNPTITGGASNYRYFIAEIDSGATAVTDLAEAAGTNDVECGLTWTAKAGTVEVHRSLTQGFTPSISTVIAETLTGSSTSFLDTTPLYDKLYYYRISDANAANPSNEVAIRMAPPRPTNPNIYEINQASIGVEVDRPTSSTRNRHVWYYREQGDYIDLVGAGASDKVSTPSLGAFTNDAEWVVRYAAADWTPLTAETIASEWNATGNQRGWILKLETDGDLSLLWSTNGTDTPSERSSVSTSTFSPVAGDPVWLKYTIDVDDGASDYAVRFWYSLDRTTVESDVSWTELGVAQDGGGLGTTSIHNSTAECRISGHDAGSDPADGKVYRLIVRDGIGGSDLADFDAQQMSFGDTTYNDGTNTWTLGGNAAYYEPPWQFHALEASGGTPPIQHLYDALETQVRYEFGISSTSTVYQVESGITVSASAVTGASSGAIVGDVTLTFTVESPMGPTDAPAIVGDVDLTFDIDSPMTVGGVAETIISRYVLDTSVHFGIDPTIGQDGVYDRESGMYVVDSVGMMRLLPIDFMPVEWATDAVENKRKPCISLEPSATNIADDSNNFDQSNVPTSSRWNGGTNFVSVTAVNGLLEGETGWLFHKSGSTNGDLQYTMGTFNSNPHCMSVVWERVNSPEFQFGSYNNTQAEFDGFMRYTYATEAIDTGSGFGTLIDAYVEKISDNGPNGGEVYFGAVSFIPQAPQTESRSLIVYPASQGAIGTGTSGIIHNVNYEEDQRYATSPIVTIGTTDTSRAVSSLQYPIAFDPSQRLTFYSRFQNVGSGLNNPTERVKVFSVGDDENTGTTNLRLEATGDGYIDMPGASGDYISTPDSAGVSITGDIDLRARIAPDDWSSGAEQSIIDKNEVGDRAYHFTIGVAGTLVFRWSTDGSAQNTESSSAAVSFSDGEAGWVRVTMDVDNGSSDADVKFYTSTDGVSWTQLGATQTHGSTTSIYDSGAKLCLGAQPPSGAASIMAGKFYKAEIYDGIDGTQVADFDAGKMNAGDTTYTDENGNLYTLNGNTNFVENESEQKFRVAINDSTGTTYMSTPLPYASSVSTLDTVEANIRWRPDSSDAIFELSVNGGTPDKTTIASIGSIGSTFDADTLWFNSWQGGVNDIGKMRLFRFDVTQGIQTLREMRDRKHNMGGKLLI